jgi:chorismate mutase
MTSIRGIRGATTVRANTSPEILAATRELLEKIVEENELAVENIASIIFSVTRDLNTEFPAVAARRLGWDDTALLCTNEIDVPGSLPRCIRVLLQVNSEKTQSQIKHVYLREAVNLRKEK